MNKASRGSTVAVQPSGEALEVTLRFLNIEPYNMFSVGTVELTNLALSTVARAQWFVFMYHPTSVRTSVQGTEQRLDCVRVWQITVGHLSRNLHTNVEVNVFLHSSIIRRWLEQSAWQVALNPFTPKGDQSPISPAASPEILHHTVWRTWLFIAYSDERWL